MMIEPSQSSPSQLQRMNDRKETAVKIAFCKDCACQNAKEISEPWQNGTATKSRKQR
jgi:hypothetical protein